MRQWLGDDRRFRLIASELVRAIPPAERATLVEAPDVKLEEQVELQMQEYKQIALIHKMQRVSFLPSSTVIRRNLGLRLNLAWSRSRNRCRSHDRAWLLLSRHGTTEELGQLRIGLLKTW